LAWSESGLYVAALVQMLSAATVPSWTLTTNQFFLTSSSDTPVYSAAIASASADYSSGSGPGLNECYGTNWAQGGLTTVQLGSIAPAVAVSGKLLNYSAGNVSVANTTISTAAYGGYFYVPTLTPKPLLMGIWFGGAPYTTAAGTFAITWSGGLIATITCAV